MKKILIILFFMSTISFFSCKKDYICKCTTTGGISSDAFTVKTTKRKTKERCDTYYKENFGSIPLNETTCEVK